MAPLTLQKYQELSLMETVWPANLKWLPFVLLKQCSHPAVNTTKPSSEVVICLLLGVVLYEKALIIINSKSVYKAGKQLFKDLFWLQMYEYLHAINIYTALYSSAARSSYPA